MRKKDKQDFENAKVSKSKLSKKRLMYYFAYLSIMAVTVVMSLYNVGFDFAKIVWERFASDLLIGYALTILLLMVSILDGENTFQEQPNGRFYHYFTLFHQKVDELVSYALTGFFNDYAHERIYEDAKRIRISKTLTQFGIHDINYIYLTNAQLKELSNGIPLETMLPNDTSGKKHFFDDLTKDQYESIMKIKGGSFSYKEIPAKWFTNDFGATDGDQYEWMSQADEHILRFKSKAIAYRMAMIGISLALFSAIFIHPWDSTQQMVVNLVTRIAISAMAIVFGYMISAITVDMRADVISYKLSGIDCFFGDYRNGSYTPIKTEDKVLKKLAEIKAEEDKKKQTLEAEKAKKDSLERLPIVEELSEPIKDDKKSNKEISDDLGKQLASLATK